MGTIYCINHMMIRLFIRSSILSSSFKPNIYIIPWFNWKLKTYILPYFWFARQVICAYFDLLNFTMDTDTGLQFQEKELFLIARSDYHQYLCKVSVCSTFQMYSKNIKILATICSNWEEWTISVLRTPCLWGFDETHECSWKFSSTIIDIRLSE